MMKLIPILLLLLLLSFPVRAHDPFEGATTARLRTNSIDLAITMNGTTAMALCDEDDLKSARFSPDIFESNLAAFKKSAAGLLEISVAGSRLTAFETNAFLGNENDVEYRLRYPRPAGAVAIKAVYLERLPREGYGAGLTILDMENNVVVGQKLLMNDDISFETPKLPEPAQPTLTNVGTTETNPTIAPPAVAIPAPPANTTVSFGEFLKLGIGHILNVAAFDHLLFLIALLVGCQRLKPMLLVITGFTLAHSLTLALAALNLVTISPHLVEPAIAASIMIVAAENFRRTARKQSEDGGWRMEDGVNTHRHLLSSIFNLRSPDTHRYALTCGFGLIHGFGFASALRASGLGGTGAEIARPLFAFNLGVEIGQLTVAAFVLPLLLALNRWPWFARHGARVISALVMTVAAFWLWQRLA